MNDVIILAGGLGTRLRHVVSDTQKAMAPVNGRPFLYYIAEYLIARGAQKIVFAVSYRSEQIREYFGNEYKGVKILYSEEAEPLGTGGAIKQALELCTSENVFILNGDTFFDVDLSALEKRHAELKADITLSVREVGCRDRSGVVVFDENGNITAFNEKKSIERGYINGGTYLVKRSIAEKLPDGKFSFETDVMEKLVFRMAAVPFDGYFIDIGVPSDFFRAQTEIPLKFGIKTFRAAFIDRDGVICKEKHHLYKTEDFEFIDGAPEALAALREKGYLVIVVTNQAGVAKGLYTEDDVNALHAYMTQLLKDRAVIDGIYYCPYHPEAVVEKYKKDSPERKPSPGMIERAVEDFAQKGINIDLKKSLMIGDTERDMETGINAGVGRKVLVRSGHTIPDEGESRADIVTDSILTFTELYL